jgi:SAM-dependent methyltransferase
MDAITTTVASFDATAGTYERRFMDCSAYAQDLRAFLDLLPAAAKVLDPGCGPGNVARCLLDARPDLKILGVDLAPAMLERFRSNVPEAEASLCDLRHVGCLAGPFDGVVASFCLPFLGQADAAAFLNALGRLCAPRGVLYLATMQGRGGGFEKTSFGGERDFYFNYFEQAFLDATLAAAGFQILSYREQIYRQEHAPDLTDMIYLCRKS